MPEITADAMGFLSRLPYPGNIRELKNLVERTILVSGSPRLDACDFSRQYNPGNATAMAGMQTMQPTSLEDMEREAIADALRRFRGNISKVAAELGVTRQTLYRKLEKYGIDR